jgi:hypothetical protein
MKFKTSARVGGTRAGKPKRVKIEPDPPPVQPREPGRMWSLLLPPSISANSTRR